MKKQETVEEIMGDWQWWGEIGEVLGLEIHGFSYRDSCSFHSPDGRDTVQIPSWFALKIRELAGIGK